LQSQFDQWYSNLHTRGFDSLAATATAAAAAAAAAASSSLSTTSSRTLQLPDHYSGSVSSSMSTHVQSFREAESKDGGVDEDIVAFYQAKEELQRLRGLRD